jgi:DNA-binding MarR family transcriptional regulator
MIPSMSLEYVPDSGDSGFAGKAGEAGARETGEAGARETGEAGAREAEAREAGAREAGEGRAREAGEAESGGGRSRQRWRLLDDPVAIRALAHPLRHDLMSIIGRLGQATTADAARELGISHGLASHHLRQLAKYGFVEQVTGKDHRERPWRLVATSYNWSKATRTAEGSVAVDVLEQMSAERAIEAFLDWQQRRKAWPQAWRKDAGLGESSVYLTRAELAEVAEACDAVLKRYIDERPIDDVASRPEGSVPVTFTLFAVPEGPPPDPDPATGA